MSLTTNCYHLVVVENRSNSDSVAVRSSCSLGTALSTHSGYLCKLQILHRLLNRDLRRLFHSSLVWVNPPPHSPNLKLLSLWLEGSVVSTLHMKNLLKPVYTVTWSLSLAMDWEGLVNSGYWLSMLQFPVSPLRAPIRNFCFCFPLIFVYGCNFLNYWISII